MGFAALLSHAHTRVWFWGGVTLVKLHVNRAKVSFAFLSSEQTFHASRFLPAVPSSVCPSAVFIPRKLGGGGLTAMYIQGK